MSDHPLRQNSVAAHWEADIRIEARQDDAGVHWHVPEEAPIALVYNGLTFAVMLASPVDLWDFVYGFSLTEGIIDDCADIRSVDLHERQQGIDIAVSINEKCFERLKLRQGRRSLEGRTSCGLCGIDSAERLFEPPRQVAVSTATLPLKAVRVADHLLADAQPLRALNHSVHGAAWAAMDGSLKLVREDVGRHNALDKLIGAMARAGTAPSDGFVFITSRASFEMVEKATRFGVQRMVALSAPTAFAIRRAKAANLMLANWSGDKLTVF